MIYFFVPSRVVGGAEKQFALLIKLAVEEGNYVCVIDTRTGIVRKLVKQMGLGPQVQFIVWSPNISLEVSHSIVITQGSYAFTIDKMIKLKNCDVRFWFMHPLSLPDMYLSSKIKFYRCVVSRLLRARYRKTLIRLAPHMFFQVDDIIDKINGFYDIQLISKPTNVLTDSVSTSNDHRIRRYDNDITVTWIGRLDAAKLRLLHSISKDISCLINDGWRIRFKIIGDGNARADLVSLLDTLNLNVCTDLLGEIKYEDLSANLIGSDLIIAQGTSILEGVKLSIPVCVVDFYSSSIAIQQKFYRLYGADGDATLGYYISTNDDLLNHEYWSLRETMDYLFRERKIDDVVNTQQALYKEFVSNGKRECCKIIDSNVTSNDDARMIGIVDFLFWRFRQIYLTIIKIKLSKATK